MKKIQQSTIKHHVYNPDCDIVTGYIDQDTFITYGIYVKPTKHFERIGSRMEHTGRLIEVGQEFMEVYTGENYVPSSKKRSHSRRYDSDSIPASYMEAWETLKEYYNQLNK